MVPANTTDAEMQLAPPLEIPAPTTDANKVAPSRTEDLLLDQEARQSLTAAATPIGKPRTASSTISSPTTPPPHRVLSEIGDSPQELEALHHGGSPTNTASKGGAKDSASGKRNGKTVGVTPDIKEDDSRSTPPHHDQDVAHSARYPSDEKYRLLKRKLKEVLEENERLGAELDRSNRRARDLRHEKNPEKRLRVPSKDVNAPFQSTHPKKTVSKPLVRAAAARKEPKEASTPSTITNVGSATQKPKRIHNSGKQGPNLSKIRKVQHVERDEKGQIKFPLTIGIITLLDIGHVVFDREAFHNERYIWPVGYKMSRSYNSMIDPTNLTTYTCSFQIDAEDQPGKPIIAGTATGAWTHVVKTANQIRRREHSNSASGPDYFGFSNATIAKMIQDLPNVDKCTSYIMQRFEGHSTTKPPVSADKRKVSTLDSSMTEKLDGEDDPMDPAEDELEDDVEDEGENEEAYIALASPETNKIGHPAQ
ncbi:hypothetical protein BGZ68_006913 [Mortierella alpina]|nr:hypothetical protein BGZ68_006913 [Mortierella alpina]